MLHELGLEESPCVSIHTVRRKLFMHLLDRKLLIRLDTNLPALLHRLLLDEGDLFIVVVSKAPVLFEVLYIPFCSSR